MDEEQKVANEVAEKYLTQLKTAVIAVSFLLVITKRKLSFLWFTIYITWTPGNCYRDEVHRIWLYFCLNYYVFQC